jgi:hypothetical protein
VYARHLARDARAHLDAAAGFEPADELVPFGDLALQRRGHHHGRHRRRGGGRVGAAHQRPGGPDDDHDDQQRQPPPATARLLDLVVVRHGFEHDGGAAGIGVAGHGPLVVAVGFIERCIEHTEISRPRTEANGRFTAGGQAADGRCFGTVLGDAKWTRAARQRAKRRSPMGGTRVLYR